MKIYWNEKEISTKKKKHSSIFKFLHIYTYQLIKNITNSTAVRAVWQQQKSSTMYAFFFKKHLFFFSFFFLAADISAAGNLRSWYTNIKQVFTINIILYNA